MLFQNATKILMTNEGPLVPGTQIQEEGVALVRVMHQGRSLLQLATGAPDELFAGFAIARNMPPQFQLFIEDGIVDSSLTHVCERMPQPGQLLIKVGDEIMTQGADAGAPAAATGVNVNGAEITFHPDHEGKAKYIQYAYELTVSEARVFTGNQPIGGLPSNIEGQCAYIKLGEVGTNMVDMSEDWSACGQHPRLSAGGKLSAGGSGTLLKNIVIVQLPTGDNPYIVVEVVGL